MLPKATQKVVKKSVFSFFVSKGSSGEVETQLLSAGDLGYLSDSDYLPIKGKRSEMTRLLNGLIKYLFSI